MEDCLAEMKGEIEETFCTFRYLPFDHNDYLNSPPDAIPVEPDLVMGNLVEVTIHDIPETLDNTIYDLEIFYREQEPTWEEFSLPRLLRKQKIRLAGCLE